MHAVDSVLPVSPMFNVIHSHDEAYISSFHFRSYYLDKIHKIISTLQSVVWLLLLHLLLLLFATFAIK